jgi:hypothetical protein
MAGEIKKSILHFDLEVSIEEFSLSLGGGIGGIFIHNLIIFSWSNSL